MYIMVAVKHNASIFRTEQYTRWAKMAMKRGQSASLWQTVGPIKVIHQRYSNRKYWGRKEMREVFSTQNRPYSSCSFTPVYTPPYRLTSVSRITACVSHTSYVRSLKAEATGSSKSWHLPTKVTGCNIPENCKCHRKVFIVSSKT